LNFGSLLIIVSKPKVNQVFSVQSSGKKTTGKIIKENLIPFINYFAINYFANFLSQNFWNKILVISLGGLASGTFLVTASV